MSDLQNKLFLQHIEKSVESVRREMREKHTPKKGNRFLIKGLTYEIGPCRIENGEFILEISSKIPEGLLFYRKKTERYFKKVVSRVNKGKKKPTSSTMDSIISSTQEEENKERNYVNLTYHYKKTELYTAADIDRRFKYHQSKKIPIPDVPGVATPGGKLVILLMEEAIAKGVSQNVLDFVAANEDVKQVFKADLAAARKPLPRKKSPAKKTAVKKKPVAKKKVAAKKPVAKKKPATKKKAAATAKKKKK